MALGASVIGRLPRARPEPRVEPNEPMPDVSLAEGALVGWAPDALVFSAGGSSAFTGASAGAGAGKSAGAEVGAPDFSLSDMCVLVL